MKRTTKEPANTIKINALLDTIYVIGGKWKLPILYAICTGENHHFRQIERNVTGITSRMLSRELREMEMNKLITRTVYPDMPVRIEYEISDYFKTIIPVIRTMTNWGISHRRKIKEAWEIKIPNP